MKKFVLLIMTAVLLTTTLSGCIFQMLYNEYRTSTTDNHSAEDIEETVLVNEKDITVTAKRLGKYEKDIFSFEKALVIEIDNQSAENISVELRNASINGYMISTVAGADVEVGQTNTLAEPFDETGLKRCGITTFADIEFSVTVTDTDTSDVILETDPVCIETFAKTDYSYQYDETGTVAYDKDGIKIVVKGVFYDEWSGKENIEVYVANKSDKAVTVSVKDGKINGKKTELYYGADIFSGKHDISSMSFGEDNTDNKDTKIKTFTGSFAVYDYTTGDVIVEKTDAITVNFE